MSIIVDIIEDIVDVVVDIVETIVDIVVDVVEVILDAVMGLLGMGEDQTVEFFEVHNHLLFEGAVVDRGISQELVASALYSNIDINAAITYDAIFGDSIQKALRRFVRYIEDGSYYAGFPSVESFINYVDESEVVTILNNIHGTPTSIDSAIMGRLTIPTWIEYWLYNNKGYDLDTRKIGTATINYTSPVYNVATDDYTVTANTPTVTDTTVNTTASGITNSVASAGHSEITDGVGIADSVTISIPGSSDVVISTTASSTSSSTTYTVPAVDMYDGVGPSDSVTVSKAHIVTAALPYTIPVKPVGTHIVATYHLDNAPTERRLFIYKVGTGTYSTLDNPPTSLSLSSDDLKVLPAVPLRANNVNFTSGTHTTEIKELLATVKLDAEGILSGITQDYTGNMNDLDFIYVNFGVRLLDTTQGALQYLFGIFEKLHASNGVTEAQYTAASGEKPYNNLIVTHDDYKYIFKYAFTTYTHYSLAEVHADTYLDTIYYSRPGCLCGLGYVRQTFYASSAQIMYKVQYQATNLSEVTSFLSGSGVLAPGTPSATGVGKLQVTVRIAYSGSILESDNTASGHTVLKPTLVYENNGSGVMRIVNQVEEDTSQSQEVTYYEVVTNGINKITVRAPIAALNVKDTESGKFKLIKFNLANPDDLTIPFFYGALPGASTQNLSSMWLASAHASIYVAHYEVIEANNNFFKLLIMIVIIVIILVVTGYTDPAMWGAVTETTVATGTAANGTIIVTNSFGVVTSQVVVGGVVTSSSIVWAATAQALGTSFITNQLIGYAIQEVLGDIAPELAMVLSVVIQMQYGMGKNIDFSSTLSIEDTLRITTIVVDGYSGLETSKYNEKFEQEEIIRKNFSQKLDTAYKALDDIAADIQEILDLGGNIVPGLSSDTRGFMVPTSADAFYQAALGSSAMSIQMYEYDQNHNQQYNYELQYQQV